MADTKVSKASRGPQYWQDRPGNPVKTAKASPPKSPDLEAIGPSMGDEWAGVSDPPNRSDQIFQGLKLPVIMPQDQVQRRDFTIPIKPTLRYYEGLDGAAETVVNRRVATQPTHVDIARDHAGEDGDGDNDIERGADLGKDPNKYQENPNDAYTLNGEWIRGT